MNIREGIKKIVGDILIKRRVCEVVSVDKARKTCVVKLINEELEIDNVRLNAVEGAQQSFTIYPKVGSEVHIDQVEGNDTDFVVSMTSEIDDMELNGNSHGGLVIIGYLLERINNLEQKLSNHQHMYILSGPGSPASTSGNGSQDTGTTKRSELENIKVKH